ncbi:MAG: hypothetical protein COV45_08335 [Deltaproteobacteria bacterium CG11_big_fil_rev_8_21_14_0_20_47_16]|nr:MAG: hypothetical protein COV45_08335 [Deltaproteobacteria bacterium CG11_big_fil_rev_8_21_14_0_20_47_16]
MLSPRAELIHIQKKIYEANQRRIHESIHVGEAGFLKYERQYQLSVAKYKRIVDHDVLLRSLISSDIIYIGDYHTCHQSQRSFLRILKTLQKNSKRPMLLCLELFHKSLQPIVDGYMAGRLSEEVFLKRIRLRERWVFDLWSNFKPILDFAKYHHIPIVGTEVAPVGASLGRRDKAAGRYIAEISEKYPEHQLLILVGDLHLAPPHLPKEVDQALKKRCLVRKTLTVFQNSDAIYWQLAKEGVVEKVDVVQLSDNKFCLMNTPPIVCQQSYLNWLEHEEGEIDFSDARHHFLELVDRIAHYLRIPLKRKQDEVEVYTCGDLSFLKKLKNSYHFSNQEIRQVKQQVMASESYFIPKVPLVYLANLSLNHAAEEASHYLKFLCTGEEKPRDRVDAFYANVLHEALGFFGSKLINPKRKCFHMNEYRALLRYFKKHRVPKGRGLEIEMARLLLAYKMWEHRGMALAAGFVFDQPFEMFFAITHALGYMLGDLMFYGLMSGAIKKSDIRKVFMDKWKAEGATYETYFRLLTKLRGVKIPKRM